MKRSSKKGEKISRRGILPLLGGGLLIPFFGFGNSANDEKIQKEEEEQYQTLLKPDGSAVRVKVKALKQSKIVKKNISNNSLLKWLGKKS